MWLKWSLPLIFLATAASAQQAPQQQDILQAMRLASSHFMAKWPDPATATTGNPSQVRTRAVYYEGLMALYSIDPKKEYYEYAAKWGPEQQLASLRTSIDSIVHNAKDETWHQNDSVLAGLVHVLSMLPVQDAHRPEYLQDYLDIVKAVHDSTTVLLTYGIAWGIREGYLDKKAYMPIISRAWNGMAAKSPHLGSEAYDLGCFLLAGSEIYQIATPPTANLDESKVPPYQEPDLLKTPDGKPITSVKGWEVQARTTIRPFYEKNVYGSIPGVSLPIKSTIDATDTAALGGLAIKKSITIHLSPTDTAARLHVLLYLPKAARGKLPVFVGYSFTPNETVESSTQWPLKDIISRGYGVAVAWYWDIEPDRPDGWQTGIRTRLADALHQQPSQWSAIGAWAWGLSKIADYLLTDKTVDPHRLIVIGHSRLGKAAVWAGATDPRFALVVSNESGEAGAALSKRDYGETIAIINDKFPWWFAPAYKQYGSDPAAMPFDQHFLLSLIAPRPLYVASAIGDQWSDPKGEFLSAKMAGAVYGLYKEKGIDTDSMPPLEHPVGDMIRYHIRNGKHDITLYDWQQYMDFADRVLKFRK